MSVRKPASKKPREPMAEPPDVERHDEIYFRHATGPMTGRVLSRGAHGMVVDVGGKRGKVYWEDYLGHKVRVAPNVTVADRGEDGFLVKNPAGHRRFVRDPMGVVAPPGVYKSWLPTVLFVGTETELLKAAGREVKNRPGLVLQPVTDSGGHQTRRWKRAAEDPPGEHNMAHGHHVKFHASSGHHEGTVNGKPGPKGVHVDAGGAQHQVLYEKITHHAAPEEEEAKPDGAGEVQGDDFVAADFAKQHDDANVTVDQVLGQFDDDVRSKLDAAAQRVQGIEQTADKYREGDTYVAERHAAHRRIFAHFLSEERIAAATPAAGEDPVFTILGGRGGSGKSKLNGLCYDAAKAIVVDPDEVKAMLPEYQGWNAHEVHEESGDVADGIINLARELGLNVVLDGTLRTADAALEKVKAFKGDGYRVEAHYMHLPRQLAAARAVKRFMTKHNDGSGRYVPLEVVLKNTDNEANFDAVRKAADAWSFYDNQVEKGAAPTLIAKGGSEAKS